MSTTSLVDVLDEARRWGFLGPGPVEPHIEHALGFARAVGDRAPARAVDLGTGGGVPGLVLAVHWPGSTWIFVEAQARRAAFLADALARLGLDHRVEVVHERAEVVGRTPERRAWASLVTARGFAAPAVTAECAAPLLEVEGALVVSEPPDGGRRWPPGGIPELGLGPAEIVQGGARYAVLRAVTSCPARYPRRVGVPAKRPLFGFT